jgi:uncharacterized protein YbjT (DUF2867 family)
VILVTGATGTVGGYLVRALCKEGAPVRALVSSPERADVLRGYDCGTAVGRYEDPRAMHQALQDVDRVFLVSPASARSAELEGAVLDAVRRAGGAHVVKLAAAGVDQPDRDGRFLEQHRAVVAQLDGLPHTVLAPHGFLQNLVGSAAAVQERGELPSLVGPAAMSFIDARDVAAVAAHVLSGTGHDGATYTLTGPRAVTYADIAAALSERLGREVRAVDITPQEYRTQAEGQDPWVVEGLLELSEVYRSGGASVVTDEVQQATGSPGRTLENFLDDHLSAFR